MTDAGTTSMPEACRECYNPLCDERVDADPDVREAYCSWYCAVDARSGKAAKYRETEGEK